MDEEIQFLCRLHDAFVLDVSERLVSDDQKFFVSLDVHYQAMLCIMPVLTGHSGHSDRDEGLHFSKL